MFSFSSMSFVEPCRSLRAEAPVLKWSVSSVVASSWEQVVRVVCRGIVCTNKNITSPPKKCFEPQKTTFSDDLVLCHCSSIKQAVHHVMSSLRQFFRTTSKSFAELRRVLEQEKKLIVRTKEVATQESCGEGGAASAEGGPPSVAPKEAPLAPKVARRSPPSAKESSAAGEGGSVAGVVVDSLATGEGVRRLFLVAYDIDRSDFRDPLCREARGPIFDQENFELITWGFSKFHAVGEGGGVSYQLKGLPAGGGDSFFEEKYDGVLVKVSVLAGKTGAKQLLVSTNKTICADDALLWRKEGVVTSGCRTSCDEQNLPSYGDLFREAWAAAAKRNNACFLETEKQKQEEVPGGGTVKNATWHSSTKATAPDVEQFNLDASFFRTGHTYLFELLHPKITSVVPAEKPNIVLLGVRRFSDGRILTQGAALDALRVSPSLLRTPTRHAKFQSVQQAYDEVCFRNLSWRREGLVFGRHSWRWKVRNPKFLYLVRGDFGCLGAGVALALDPDWRSILDRFPRFEEVVVRSRERVEKVLGCRERRREVLHGSMYVSAEEGAEDYSDVDPWKLAKSVRRYW